MPLSHNPHLKEKELSSLKKKLSNPSSLPSSIPALTSPSILFQPSPCRRSPLSPILPVVDLSLPSPVLLASLEPTTHEIDLLEIDGSSRSAWNWRHFFNNYNRSIFYPDVSFFNILEILLVIEKLIFRLDFFENYNTSTMNNRLSFFSWNICSSPCSVKIRTKKLIN